MNRRSFIRQSTLATGAVLFSSISKAIASPPLHTQVVIIGAGLAGLSAAYQLKQNNIPFIIIESRSRVGGRVFSHKINDHLVIELGGEWVGNSHTRLQELCNELHLTLENNQLDTHLIYKGVYSSKSQWSYSKGWSERFRQIINDYPQLSEDDRIKLDQYDWWHYLVNNGCEGRDLEIRELLDSTDFGESIRHVSAFAALAEYAESSEKNEMDLKIMGGNSMLPEALWSQIGKENVLLGHHVVRVEQGKTVTITCDNGYQVKCDQVICTTPAFSLSKIQWLPALPTTHSDALLQLQYARINKHALHFSKRFWQDEAFDLISDQGPHYFYHATKNQKGNDGVLIAYSIGDKAAMNANQSDSHLADDVIRCLKPGFGNIGKYLEGQTNYYWGNDKYSCGAYALYGAGQWFTLRPQLSQSFMNIHFAGEHLADWQGFMEGAINTGEAAAAQVMG